MEEIKEDIKEEVVTTSMNIDMKIIREMNNLQPAEDKETLRKSFEESEVDGLIKWAIGLPDDFANNSSSSFFKKAH